METFEFNGQIAQFEAMSLYALSPAMLAASDKQIARFIKVYIRYLPDKSPYESAKYRQINLEGDKMARFKLVYAHVSQLLQQKQQRKHHLQLFWVSVVTAAILAGSLFYTGFVLDAKMADLDARLAAVTRALNQRDAQDAVSVMAIPPTPAATN